MMLRSLRKFSTSTSSLLQFDSTIKTCLCPGRLWWSRVVEGRSGQAAFSDYGLPEHSYQAQTGEVYPLESTGLEGEVTEVCDRRLHYPPPAGASIPESLVGTLMTLEDTRRGLIPLHPDVFDIYPRIDVIHQNVEWQKIYRKIDYRKEKSRAEVPGSTRKPWPQKGTGRARHGDRRSPIWHKGGKAMGLRGPKAFFYMLSKSVRSLGLRSALTMKYVQGDLFVVDSLHIPEDDPEYLTLLADVRFWADSVLFVDQDDVLPRNTAVALSQIPHFNAMPVYGLNVYSLMKHCTLVLTVAAVDKIEERLLFHLHSSARQTKATLSASPQPFVRDPNREY